MTCLSQETLDKIFPADRTDAFFEALYGGAEEGAYDIRLICENIADGAAHMAFELNRRPSKCLKCSLTYGLPAVFQRHPIINMAGIANAVARTLGWGSCITWKLGATREISDEQHLVPFSITKA